MPLRLPPGASAQRLALPPCPSLLVAVGNLAILAATVPTGPATHQ
jgi:hypothetical protein